MTRPSFASLLFFSAAASASLASACSRTPPEPEPASSAAAATTTTTTTTSTSTATSTSAPASSIIASAGPTPSIPATADAGRCIAKLAAVAPAIPAVASVDVCPKDPTGTPKSKSAVVTFPETPSSPKLDVEIASSESEVTRGLMYRRSMPEEHGMLFRLEERRDHTFWMHNTCMPLDMIFVDDDGFIVGIVESAQPLTDSSRSTGCDSHYVVEVNAGWCRRHGVQPGQKLAIPANAR